MEIISKHRKITVVKENTEFKAFEIQRTNVKLSRTRFYDTLNNIKSITKSSVDFPKEKANNE